jgi:hypothetical protein
MDHPCRRFAVYALVLSVLSGLLLPAQAKMSAWKDVQGASFKGEPTDILGPFVIFRISGGGGRRVLLRAFSTEECLWIRAEIAGSPARSASFAEAKGIATRQLVGRVQRVQKGELVPADLVGQREPDLLLVLSGSHNSGDGWFMSGSLQLFYWRVQRIYPGLMEGIFLGARHDAAQHRTIAVTSGMPWLVTDFLRQEGISSLRHYVPKTDGTNVVLVTRQGVPLLGSPIADIESVRTFADAASEFLWQIDPANPAGWSDRLHYLNATRPVEYAQSRAEPLLVGNPLRPEVLRKYGIKRVAARLAVAPDGKITPTILSGPEDMPPELKEAMSTALSRAVVAPALEQGRPVAGSLDYHLEVPAADPRREGEQLWLSSTSYPVLPLTEWLVLRPIQVSEQDFDSGVVGERADGTVILSSFEVNSGKISRKAQMSAFNSDWFSEAGADSVRPKAGDRQLIDGETVLKWEPVRSKNGFVDLQTSVPKDYTVGYAWTEFESPRETEAWLGLGSDDGVKLWLNGELVHDQWVRRPSRLDDEIVPLHLKKGANRILIKIQNATGEWNFMHRLRLKP